ncbi:MAG: dihydroorotase, partial [Chloroflexota bacterium]
MITAATLLRGGRVIDPSQGLDAVADLLLNQGRVAWCSASGGPMPAGSHEMVEAAGMVVAPGFVDLHCHLREPGYEHKETIATGTRAAAAGGFTTVCAMANTRPVMDERAVVELVLRIAKEGGAVRVLPIGAVTRGLEGKALAAMAEMAEAGVVAFSDDGQPVWDAVLMRHAMEYGLMFGLPIIDHCQDPALTKGATMHEGSVSTRLGVRGWPAAGEDIMVARNIELSRLTGARVHIAHLSTAGGVEMVRRGKAEGLAVTAEVTPHHLTLTHERVLGCGHGLAGLTQGEACGAPEPYDTLARVAPPLRTESDIEALIAGLNDGTIDCIATDHAPHALEDKLCEFDQAANGISCFETAFGSLMSLVHRGAIDLPLLISNVHGALSGLG